ncbi:hypothetical protein VCRA2113O199_80183 [Vibrio crassostreae]|uniref:Uncharacterized protein n=1 Tax=Vibrio crassostreae TaxID=246167 RepID=A0A822MRF7_9VIBR|nr:hypothetical protein VCRA2113O218_290036 [Vibrio crassostreae]CAK1970566.1 hypothetical protein VCRA2113O193_280036 [Vibrio crassostreae]CAK1971114.1 hypothetical protein VCRA2113O200_290036 [Vibrio crassostreae]CAK1980450.1 hypothetical protein VCRA2113O212_280036 [Vibrio crassostreae]CAK2017076.1 hypothetical protein VCRA2116O234_300035 [Vibrio crassostreae]
MVLTVYLFRELQDRANISYLGGPDLHIITLFEFNNTLAKMA